MSELNLMILVMLLLFSIVALCVLKAKQIPKVPPVLTIKRAILLADGGRQLAIAFNEVEGTIRVSVSDGADVADMVADLRRQLKLVQKR